MENKNTDTNVTYVSDDIGVPISSNFGVAPAPEDAGALSLDPQQLIQQPAYAIAPKRVNRLFGALKRVDAILILLIVLAGLGVFIANISKQPQTSNEANAASQFNTVKLPLSGFVSGGQTQAFGSSSVIINGSLKLNDGLVVSPSVQPNSPTSGQLYFDQNTNQLAYYNGTSFVPLSAQKQSVQSLGGATGQITLGGGLTIVGSQLDTVATNPGVTSFDGQTGAITIGNGLKLSGSSIGLSSLGVQSLTSGTNNLVIANDGNGNLTINDVGAGTGTVTSSGGASGIIPVFNGLQDIENSLISETGTSITVNGDTIINGGLSLGNKLTVSNGGTGTNSLAANGVVVANGTAAFTSIVAGGTGLCLLSTAGSPTWSACPGNSGVLTLNGLAGALTIANASAAGSTITIDSASTSTQGIASFNSTNFTAAGGAINTIQDINTTSAPTFGRLTLSSGQATQPMFLVNNTNASATGDLLDLQLAGVSKFSVQPNGGLTTVGTINGQTISNAANFTGTLGVGSNAVVSGNLAVNGGTLSSTGTLSITPSGNLTVGSSSQSLVLQGSNTILTATNGGNVTTLDFQAPTATVTYNLPTAAAGTYDICTTAGNCSGSGGVTSLGGTINTLAKFSGSQSVANSSITDNGTTVTTSANLVVQGGQATIGVANSQSGALSLAYGAANFTGTISQGVLSANQTYTLPNQSGTFCLSSGNCLGGASGGANTSLSNLNSVAINTTLLPGSTSIDLGSATAPFRNLYISGSSSSPGTNNFDITGTATASRTITLPDASGTVCLNNSTNCGFLTGVGTAFVQNGNTLGTAANIGTDDNFALNLLTDGVTRLSIDNAGAATFSSNVTINGSTLSSAGALNVNPGGTLTVGVASQALKLQGNGSTTLVATTSGHTTTVGFSGTPVGNVSYDFDTSALAGTYTICTTIGNCAGSGGGVTTSGGTTGTVALFTAGQAIGNSSITDNGTTVTTSENLTVQGSTVTVGIPNAQTGTLALAYGSASASGSIVEGALTANRTYTLPDASGTVCLSSGNCLGGGGGGANTSLSNLSSVAINTTLLPGSTSIDLGSATAPFRNLYISGSSSSPGTNNFDITGTATASRTITLPDASGTVCLNNSTNCGFATGSGSAFVQNGNSFGATGVLGSNDNNALQIRTNGITHLTIAAAGDATFTGNVAVNGGTLSSAAALNITPGGAFTVGSTAQTLTLQGNTSTTLSATSGGNTTTVGFSGVPTGAVNYNFNSSATPGTYTICSTIGNCAGAGSGVTTPGGTSGTIAVFTGTQIIGNSLLSQSGSTVTANGNINLTTGNQYEINGSQISSASLSDGSNLAKLNSSETFTGNNVTFQNVVNSGNAFDINDLSGNQVLAVSTNSGGSVILGKASTSNGTLIFNNISNANTVTVAPGTVTANRTLTLPDVSGTICTSSGNCAGAGSTLQTAYNFSIGGTTPKIKLNNTLNGFDIQDADTSIGADLFDVRASNGSGLGAVMFGVGNTGAIALKNSVNSHSALTVSTLGSTQILGVDTINGTTVLGQSTVLGGSLVFNNSTNSNAITLVAAAPASNRTLTLPDAGSTICTDAGNCAGTGGGVTTPGGTTNTIAKFTGSQTLGNSGITDNGTTVGIGELLSQSGSASTGTIAAFSGTDSASSGASAVLGVSISLVGTNNATGSNTITGLNFNNVTAATNNTFNGISFGTGYNSLLGYNGTTLISGTGLLQNAALDSTQTYSNLQKVGTLTVGSIASGFGVISTGNNIVTTATLQGGNVQVGASAGTGSFVNNGTTLDTVDSSQSFSANGSIANINTYSAILITATNPGLTLTLPNPSPTTAGKVLYISNASSGSNLFTLAPASGGSMPLNAGATTTLLWNGSAWTYAGTDASSILNQNSTIQTGNFDISGTGIAGTLQVATSGSLDTSTSGTLTLAATNATSIALDQSVTVASGKNVTLTSGNLSLTNGNLAVSSGTSSFIYASTSSASATSITVTNSNTSVTAATLKGVSITPVGTANGNATNTIFGIALNNATTAAGNTIVGINVGTGYNATLKVNGTTILDGSGLLQNAALDSTLTYSNLQKVGTLTVGSIASGFGSISTANNIVTTATLQGGAVQVGASAGAGSFTNNGTTLDTVDSSQSFSANGSIANINSYSAIVITATNPGLTLTLPNPSPTTAGKILYISNASSGSNLFTLAPTSGTSMPLNTGATTSLLWNGSAWTYAGTDASSILNQNSTIQTGNFYISGVGEATNGFQGSSIDSISGTLAIGATHATAINIGNATSNIATTINGTALVQPTSGHDSANAFQVKNGAGTTSEFNVDTTSNRVSVGGNGTATGQFYVSGQLPSSVTGSVGTGASSSPDAVAVSSNYAYVALDGTQVLDVVDISNPSSPVSITTVSLSLGPNSISINGHYLYIVGNSSLLVYDISNPRSPVSVGSASTDFSATSVYAQGRYVYVGTVLANTFEVYDVSKPSSPTLMNDLSLSNDVDNIYVSGRYAYLAETTSNQLQIIDISNPASPTSVGTVSTGASTSPRSVYVQGRYAYVVDSNANSFQIIDISNPASPSITGTLSIGVATSPWSVYVQGRYAYIVNASSATIQIVDVSTPSAPASVGTLSVSGSPDAITVQGRDAYVVNNGSNKLQVVDLGGSYEQQGEFGGIQTGTLAVTSNSALNGDVSIQGSTTIGQSLQVSGTLGVGSSASSFGSQTALVGNAYSGIAIQGTSVSSTGVNAISTSGNALVGTSGSGLGVFGQSSSSNSAVFSSSSAGNTATTLAVVQNTTSTANLFVVSGPSPGYVAKFQIASNGDLFSQLSGTSANALQIENAGGTNLINIDTSGTNPVVNLGVTGSVAQAGTVNVGTSTGAAETVSVGSTASGSSTAIQGGTGGISLTSTGGAINLTPGAASTIGATGQQLTIQGNSSSTIVAANGANTTTLSFTTPTSANSIVFPNASGTVALTPLSGGYLQQAPSSTATNTVIPTTASVVGLTVQGTSGTSADAAIFSQNNSTSTADTVQISTVTTSGTQTNVLLVSRNGISSTTTNGINITNTSGTLSNGLTLTATTAIGNGINFAGLGGYTNLISATNFAVTNAGNITAGGTYNTNTFNSSTLQFGAGSTATVDSASGQALQIGTGANAHNITVGNITSTSTLTLQSGSGGVLLGTTAQNTITIGSTAGTSGSQTINVGSNAAGGTDAVTIGSTTGASSTVIQGGTGGSINSSSVDVLTNATQYGLVVKSLVNEYDALQIEESNGHQAFSVSSYAGQEAVTVGDPNNGVGSNLMFADGSTSANGYNAKLTGIGNGGAAYYTAYQSILVPNLSGTMAVLQSGNGAPGTSQSGSFNDTGTGVLGTGLNVGGVSIGTATLKVTNTTPTAIFTVDTTTDTGADLGRIIVGSGSTGETTPVELILDNSTTTADPIGVNGAMYYNANENEFRCFANGYWGPCGMNPIDQGFLFQDDFLSGTAVAWTTAPNNLGGAGQGALGWDLSESGSGSLACNGYYNYANAINAPTMSHDHPGVLDLQTGTNGGNCELGQGGGTTYTPTLSEITGAGDDFKTTVALGSVSAGTIFRFGMINSTTTAAPTSGFWFDFNAGSSANWRYCYANNGGAVCAASTTAASASTWTRLEIRVISNTAITYYVNGTAVATLTGITYDNGTTNKLGPQYLCYATSTNSEDCYIDYFSWSGIASASGR